MEVRDVGCTKPRNAERICAVDLRKIWPLDFTKNGHGHMEVYHVPVGWEEKWEWWDPMTLLKATWTLMNVPRDTMVVGDHYAMWARRVKQIKISEVGGWKGKQVWKPRGSKTWSPGYRKPECPKVLKCRKRKFRRPENCRAEWELRKLIWIKMFFVLVCIGI